MSLQSKGEYAYQAVKNNFKLYFKNDLTKNKAVSIRKKGSHNIHFSLDAIGYYDLSTDSLYEFGNLQGGSVSVSGNSISYENLLPGIHARFYSQKTKIKEDIEITQAARNNLVSPSTYNLNADSTLLVFVTEMKLSNKLLVKNRKRKRLCRAVNNQRVLDVACYDPLYFHDSNDDVSYTLPLDYAYLKDPNDSLSNYIQIKRRIVTRGNKVLVISGVSYNWLQSLSTGTVVLDPSVYDSRNSSTSFDDTYLVNDSTSSTVYGLGNTLMVGKSPKEKKFLINFPIHEIPLNVSIDEASLKYYKFGIDGSVSIGFPNMKINMSVVYSEWDEKYANYTNRTNNTPWQAPFGNNGNGP